MSVLVSVAMATYNGARFLREQLESIYSQTYKNIDVVVTDDRSVDGTQDILEEYRRKKGLKFEINQKRLGVMKNFERAILGCSGDFIALSDQDDIWLPHKIERLMAQIGDHSLICSDAGLCDSAGKEFAPSFYRYSNIYVPPRTLAREWTLVANFVTGCTALFAGDLMEKALPIPLSAACHDWWLAVVASRERGIRFLDEPLLLYRQHGDNAVGVASKTSRVDRALNLVWPGLSRDEHRSARRRRADENLSRLRGMQEQPIFDSNDRRLIADLRSSWEDMTRNGLHWKSATLLWQRRKLLLPGRTSGFAVAKCVQTLLR